MLGKQITIEVKVNLDQVPGWGNDPEDFVKMIQHNLTARIPHYHPEVRLVEEWESQELQQGDRFLVDADDLQLEDHPDSNRPPGTSGSWGEE